MWRRTRQKLRDALWILTLPGQVLWARLHHEHVKVTLVRVVEIRRGTGSAVLETVNERGNTERYVAHRVDVQDAWNRGLRITRTKEWVG
jgi:hypothetical protein